MQIEVRNVTKRFESFTALRDLSLQVRPGELVALLGPSGSGKTTLLRIIAGLEFANEGQVLFDGADAGTRRVGERRVGFVFQHYALFRHMSVFENIAFGLRVAPAERRMPGADIKKRVMFGSVTVSGLPSLSCETNSGMTEPREAMTLP